jgi:hypothetical protein
VTALTAGEAKLSTALATRDRVDALQVHSSSSHETSVSGQGNIGSSAAPPVVNTVGSSRRR